MVRWKSIISRTQNEVNNRAYWYIFILLLWGYVKFFLLLKPLNYKKNIVISKHIKAVFNETIKRVTFF